MKLAAVFLALSAVSAVSVRAQEVTNASMQIAQITMDRNWESTQRSLPSLLGQLETKFRQQGVSVPGAAVFTEELLKVVTKDSFVRLYARTIATNYTDEEQRQVLVFLQSPAGTKFQQLKFGEDVSPLLRPIVRQACAGVIARTSGQDQQEFHKVCAGI